MNLVKIDDYVINIENIAFWDCKENLLYMVNGKEININREGDNIERLVNTLKYNANSFTDIDGSK